MDDNKKGKKRKRNQTIGKKLKKKEINEAIKAAYLKEDHLQDFPDFVNFDLNGLSVTLESASGSSLTTSMKEFIQNLLKTNMENVYDADWPEEEKVKQMEITAPDALYVIARNDEKNVTNEFHAFSAETQNREQSHQKGSGSRAVAFVHYRFVKEEEFPVLYIYELQLEKDVQGKGLGKFLMQLMELIAHKNKMSAVMLTVQKRNVSAINFYTKLSYKISSHSPSRVDPEEWTDCSYEIMCKAISSDAKVKFEVGDGN